MKFRPQTLWNDYCKRALVLSASLFRSVLIRHRIASQAALLTLIIREGLSTEAIPT